MVDAISILGDLYNKGILWIVVQNFALKVKYRAVLTVKYNSKYLVGLHAARSQSRRELLSALLAK